MCIRTLTPQPRSNIPLLDAAAVLSLSFDLTAGFGPPGRSAFSRNRRPIHPSALVESTEHQVWTGANDTESRGHFRSFILQRQLLLLPTSQHAGIRCPALPAIRRVGSQRPSRRTRQVPRARSRMRSSVVLQNLRKIRPGIRAHGIEPSLSASPRAPSGAKVSGPGAVELSLRLPRTQL